MAENRTIIFALKFTSGWKPGNRIFPWVFILPAIIPSFVFRFATRKTRRTPFRKIEMPNVKPCELCFHTSFLSPAVFFPFFSPSLRLSVSPSLLGFCCHRESCSYESAEFLARKGIIRLTKKPIESSKLNRNWIAPLPGNSNVDRKSESV